MTLKFEMILFVAVCVCVCDSLEISLLLKGWGRGVSLCEVVTASRLLFLLSPEFD